MIVRYCISTRMILFRTRKLFGIDQLTRIHHPHVCRMSTTSPAWFPPLRTPCPVITRSQYFIHRWIPAPSHMQCTALEHCQLCACHVLYLYCYCCCVFTVPPPYSPVDPRYYRRWRCCVRLLRRRPYPYYRATRKAEPLPLSLISSTFLYLSVALGICCCYVTFLFKCIACLCRPLMYLSFILLQPNIYYIQQLALRFVSQ